MCWSFEWSLGAGVMSYLVAIYLLWRGRPRDKGHALFITAYCSVQFVDSLLWYDEAENGLETCSPRNKFVTRYLLAAVLSFEVWVSARTSEIRDKLPEWWMAAVTATAGIIFYLLHNTCTILSPQGGLWWGGITLHPFQIVPFFYLLIHPRSRQLSWMHVGVVFIIYLWRPEAFGSYWCAIAALYSFSYVLQQ